MKRFPAIDVRAGDADLLYALLDDFAPTAIEEREDTLRAFFASDAARDAALTTIASQFDASPIDVPDDDWARRSQQNLAPITVGRITIVTSGTRHQASASEHPAPAPGTQHQSPSTREGTSTHHPSPNTQHPLFIVIEPSMGFGTGHHATTRLCLAALQIVGVAGQRVLDVGTGSGVLAIAADRLGATDVLGIDVDPDAIQAAQDNLALNLEATRVSFEVADLAATALPLAGVVTANLTGALLERSASTLLAATRPGGILILSGLMTFERDAVVRAFAPAVPVWEQGEDEWVGLAMKKP